MHESSTSWKKDNSSSLKELLGRWLFFLYGLVYAGFILVNVVSPQFMGMRVGSLNVAIAYGFLLILFAMILAFAYNHVSTHAEEVMNSGAETEEPGQ